MTAYYVGDTPAQPLQVVPERSGVPVDLSLFTGAEVRVDGHALTTTKLSDHLSAAWPATSLFTEEGLYLVTVTLTGTSGKRETFEGEAIAVQAETGWHTLKSIEPWLAGADLNDDVLWTLLRTSRMAVETYGEPVAEDETVPLNYRQAQALQTRNALNAARTSPSGDLGDGSFALTPFPLDWAVKSLIRPQSAIPKVG